VRVVSARVTRKYNLGNYQSIDLTLEAEVEKGDDPIQTLKTLEKAINDYYQGRTADLATID